MTARQVVNSLKALSSPGEAAKVRRFFRGNDDGGAPDNRIMGVAFGKVFAVAKQFIQTPLAEIETLLESPFYEARLAGVSIMDFQARRRATTPAQRQALFDLYLRRHDRINNWDLVDRAAPHVVGRHLIDGRRDVLYRLARSPNPWERRTAIVSTYYFIRSGDVAETFGIAALLVDDRHELVQKAAGSWLREAGKQDRAQLVRFLDTYAARMPAVMVRYASENIGGRGRATRSP